MSFVLLHREKLVIYLVNQCIHCFCFISVIQIFKASCFYHELSDGLLFDV